VNHLRGAVPAVLLGLVMLLHTWIPNTPGNVGSLVETFLPWFGLGVPLLFLAALVRRSVVAGAALLVPVVVWASLFGGRLLERGDPSPGFTVVSHNIGADNPEPAETARALAASGAALIAIQELTLQAKGDVERVLAADYPFSAVRGTVGLWSRTPLTDVRPVDVGLDSTRGLRATAGPLTVYVVHLGSVRVFPRNGFWTESRDAGIDAVARTLAEDPSERVVLLGDLNGTLDDRRFAPLTAQLAPAETRFGFTWPAAFPIVRSDQVLVRGLEPEAAWTLPATTSDHLPVAARLTW
jgi:vancomycin resistance protein VanJ